MSGVEFAVANLRFEPFHLKLQTLCIFLHLVMRGLQRNNFFADHVHGDEDLFFVVWDFHGVDMCMRPRCGPFLAVMNFAMLHKDWNAILHGAAKFEGSGDKVAKMGDVGHEKRAHV